MQDRVRALSDSAFTLDQNIERDTALVVDLELSQARLMNDNRFPWIVLVPRASGASELFDLNVSQADMLWREIRFASTILKATFPCDKINVAALGNKVRQLHVHIVARSKRDAAWPGVVWDKGQAVAYEPDLLHARIAALRAAF